MTRTRPCVRKLLVSLLVPAVLIIAVASAQNIPVGKPEEVGMSSVRLQQIRKTLQAEVDKGNMPGAVGMINRKGKLIYSEITTAGHTQLRSKTRYKRC